MRDIQTFSILQPQARFERSVESGSLSGTRNRTKKLPLPGNTMTLRFEKNCYPDVNIYRQRKELGLNPIPRKPNVWSRNRSLQHSASDILSQGTARQSTSFCRSFKRQGYRHDLARTKDRKMEQEYCLYTNKISTSDESEYGRFVSIDRLLFLMIKQYY